MAAASLLRTAARSVAFKQPVASYITARTVTSTSFTDKKTDGSKHEPAHQDHKVSHSENYNEQQLDDLAAEKGTHPERDSSNLSSSGSGESAASGQTKPQSVEFADKGDEGTDSEHSVKAAGHDKSPEELQKEHHAPKSA